MSRALGMEGAVKKRFGARVNARWLRCELPGMRRPGRGIPAVGRDINRIPNKITIETLHRGVNRPFPWFLFWALLEYRLED